MDFRDRITKIPEEVKEIVNINISLNDDGTIWLWINPKGGDIKKSADAMIDFLINNYILTGIAMIKDISTWDIEDWIKMMDDLMELWENRAAWWKDLTHNEKKQILSVNNDEDVANW